MDVIIESVSVLVECIENLDINLGDAMAKAHEVEELKNKANVIERKIRKTIYQLYRDEKIGILTLIELNNIVLRLVNVVDRAEDTSDRALIIAAKRHG
jgi:predicted phosphate transport protein (TIGR00153 family)